MATDNADSRRGWIERWLSAPRFARYLEACGGDSDAALVLYEWNLDLGQALMKEIAYFEVALRNAYDREIAKRWDGCDHWLFDADSPVNVKIPRRARSGSLIDANALNRQKIAEASHRVASYERQGKTIAGLSFGFWAHLTDKPHERVLWIPYLHHAWPKGTNRADLDERLRAINACRNRVAHHERLFNPKRGSVGPVAASKLICELFSQLAPEVVRERGPIMFVERFLQDNPNRANVEI